jgi:uncharacterized membrane protein YhhN
MGRSWGFVPYVIVGVVHVASLATGVTALSGPTKVALMPALALALFVSLPRGRNAVAFWGGLALLFAWGGDVLLSTPEGTGFVVGLGLFMLAHAAYLVLFLRPLKDRRIPRLAFFYVPWWAALLVLLAPYLGVLLVPVAVYGLVLGASAAAALGTTRIIAIGALVFLCSDTLLAFKLFYPGFLLWQQDAIIMLGYIAGQGLIIAGAVQHSRANAGTSVTPRGGVLSPVVARPEP